jgi:hypothetical protein
MSATAMPAADPFRRRMHGVVLYFRVITIIVAIHSLDAVLWLGHPAALDARAA